MVTCRPFAMIRQATDDEVEGTSSIPPGGTCVEAAGELPFRRPGHYPPGVYGKEF